MHETGHQRGYQLGHEIAVVTSPRDQVRVPQADGLVIHRELDPNRDAVMTDEQLASSLGILRNDLRVLITLALSHGVHTPAEIRDFYQDKGLPGQQPLDRKDIGWELTFMSRKGAIERSEIPGGSYSTPEWSDSLAAQAGHLADFSRKYPTPISNFVGQPWKRHESNNNGHPRIDHTTARIMVLRHINRLRRDTGPFGLIPLGQAGLAKELGITEYEAEAHLKSLEHAGIFTRMTANTKEGSTQRYRLVRDIPQTMPAPIAHKHGLTDWVREYAQMNFYNDLSTDNALSYLWEFMPGVQDLDPTELKNLYQRIRDVFGNLRKQGEVQPLLKEGVSVITFEPQSNQVQQLRDFVLTLFDMQREDRRGEEEGLKKGRDILSDPYAVSYLVEKVHADPNP